MKCHDVSYSCMGYLVDIKCLSHSPEGPSDLEDREDQIHL